MEPGADISTKPLSAEMRAQLVADAIGKISDGNPRQRVYEAALLQIPQCCGYRHRTAPTKFGEGRMRFLGALFLVGTLAVILGLFQRDHMRVVCFDEGRKVGGAEQRIFLSRTDGEDPLKTDQDIALMGKDCR